MKKEYIKIKHIPAIVWGESSQKVMLAVHGNMSHKEDTVIEMLACEAISKGYQVLSFDLPKHGDRKDEEILCKVQNCVLELNTIMDYLHQHYRHIHLFACSLGAYFAMMSYQNEDIESCLFLSPVLDMKRIIENMMKWFNIDEKMLQIKKEVATPIGQTLYWDYYCYVKEHPVTWKHETAILYGGCDEMCERDILDEFVDHHQCKLVIMEDGEHFFHTPQQLQFYQQWLKVHV